MARKYGAYGTVGPAKGFTWDEVRCTDGSLPGDSESRKRFAKQARNLNRLRRIVRKNNGGYRKVRKVSISPNSWYRSPEYNRIIGGAPYSQHVEKRATDLTMTVDFRKAGKPNKTLHPRRVAELATKVRAFRNGGIGWYDENHGSFCHLDHRPDGPARWING